MIGEHALRETAGVAVRERCGRLIVMGVAITEANYQGRVVSEVTRLDELFEAVLDVEDPPASRQMQRPCAWAKARFWCSYRSQRDERK